MLSLTSLVPPAFAYEHVDSLVDFQEYSENVITRNKYRNKPYFLLFSADWCYWCHQFADNTLVRQDVADYLNQHFVNVFIDADINKAAYVKYRAIGLPYTVFLNPDGSLYYKYAGTLYGDNFLAVIKEVAAKTGIGKYALGMEANHVSYTPPTRLSLPDLEDMPASFIQGLLENFDTSEYGLGMEQKAILPRTFMYLLENADAPDRKQVIDWTIKTLERAIDRIYDPVEGGFYRYAETRSWQRPHFEKLADLNAGAVLLLYQVNQVSPSPRLKKAADKTLAYLSSTLFHPLTGTFLSFQVADHSYYSLNKEQRKSAVKPRVMDKVFTDRLAVTLGYLIRVIEYTEDRILDIRVRQSLDFLARMIVKNESMNRYYVVTNRQWLGRSGLSDYAHVASLFTDAAVRFENTFYEDIATRVVKTAIRDFYDDKKRVFIDPNIGDSTNVEYLMSVNGLLAQSITRLGARLEPRDREIVGSLITYFSLMGEVLEDRFWNADEWEFAEAYVPYLQLLEQYTSTRSGG
ncbi:MAG: thioredoxin domain-containing protein [Proteobacteria bacterium]|nr:thioredoxin domain-containing protein [Pseudomonadota bacterium]